MLVNELHGMIVVDARQQGLLPSDLGDDGSDGLRNIGTVGVERHGMFVEEHLRVAADVAAAREVRLQLLDAHAQLHVVGQTRFLVEVHVEAADVVVRGGQTAVEQLSAAYNLHTQAARADKGQHRLRNQTGAIPHGFCLVETAQIVHFKQY